MWSLGDNVETELEPEQNMDWGQLATFIAFSLNATNASAKYSMQTSASAKCKKSPVLLLTLLTTWMK